MRSFPEVKIEEKPIYDNELTRRTEQSHCSGTTRGLQLKDQAFRDTIDYVLGEGWYTVNKQGRIMHEKRNIYNEIT